jgi:hypothetical protein
MGQSACFLRFFLDNIAHLCYSTLSSITLFYMSNKLHYINLSFQWNIIISQQLHFWLLSKQAKQGHANFRSSEKVKDINKSPIIDSQKTKCAKTTKTNILLLFQKKKEHWIFTLWIIKTHENTEWVKCKFFTFWFYVFNPVVLYEYITYICGPGSSVGIATGYGLGGPGIESRWRRNFSPWGPSSLLYNGYRVFPGGKAAGAWCWPPTPS